MSPVTSLCLVADKQAGITTYYSFAHVAEQMQVFGSRSVTGPRHTVTTKQLLLSNQRHFLLPFAGAGAAAAGAEVSLPRVVAQDREADAFPFSRCFTTYGAVKGQLCSVSLPLVFDWNLIDFIVGQELILMIFGFVRSLCFGLSEDRHRRSEGLVSQSPD